VKMIASFPGIEVGVWLDIITHPGSESLSSPTVFFPDKLPGGSKHPLCGKHDEEHKKKHGHCHCEDIYLRYGKEEPWGCMWWKKWMDNVLKALAAGQEPVIVYQDWLHPKSTDKLLGGSQQGEERFLQDLLRQGKIKNLYYLNVRDLHTAKV